MTIRVRRILRQVGVTIQDPTAVRWPLAERYDYLEDGIYQIGLHEPSALSRTVVVGLDAGTRQSIPDDAIALHKVNRNMAGLNDPYQARDAITVVDAEVLNLVIEDWGNPNAVAAQKQVTHVLFDEIDPRTYHVYPPNDGTGRVEIIVSKVPNIPSAPPKRNQLESWNGIQINLARIYEQPLVDYILYRCYAKDAAFAGNAARAASHFQLFAAAVKMKNAKEIVEGINALGAPAVSRSGE